MNDIARAPGSSTSVFIHERNVTVKLMKLITELYIKGLCSPPGFTCKITTCTFCVASLNVSQLLAISKSVQNIDII